jgi:hypothetical protein
LRIFIGLNSADAPDAANRSKNESLATRTGQTILIAHANGAADAMPAVYGFLRGSQVRAASTSAFFPSAGSETRCRDTELRRPAGRFTGADFKARTIAMKIATLSLIAASALTLAACGSTTDQRIGGAAVGAGTGAVVAGPVGAVVGGAAGAVTAPTVVRTTRRATR